MAPRTEKEWKVFLELNKRKEKREPWERTPEQEINDFTKEYWGKDRKVLEGKVAILAKKCFGAVPQDLTAFEVYVNDDRLLCAVSDREGYLFATKRQTSNVPRYITRQLPDGYLKELRIMELHLQARGFITTFYEDPKFIDGLCALQFATNPNKPLNL